MKNNKILKILLPIAVVLIIFAVIGKKAGWFGKALTVKVAVENAEKRTIVETITANGKIQPEIEIKITPDVSGEIVELNVKEGDYVNKGHLLLKIKPDNYMSARDRAQASLNAAKANLANAQAVFVQVEARNEQSRMSYERNKKLWEDKTISASEWEAIQSGYEITRAEVTASKQNIAAAEFAIHSAEASLKEAMENLLKTSVYAPMEGTITLLDVEKGERVVGTELMSGTEMLRVANLENMEVLTEVNENDIVRISAGDSAIISIDAFPEYKFKGLVTDIANSASVTGLSTDQITNFDVKILLLRTSYQQLLSEKNQPPFRPGMSASVDIITNFKSGILTVPLQSVTLLADSLFSVKNQNSGVPDKEANEAVFLYDKGKAKPVVIKTGIQDNDFIEILEGINEGMEVITSPYNVINKKLRDGSLVRKVSKNKLLDNPD